MSDGGVNKVKLTIQDDAFADAGIVVSGINLVNKEKGSNLRILGRAEAEGEHIRGLDYIGEAWGVAAVAMNAEGKVVGIGYKNDVLYKSPVGSFDIAVEPECCDKEDIVEVELYPFVARLSHL